MNKKSTSKKETKRRQKKLGKLQINKETLKDLNPSQPNQVQGGAANKGICTWWGSGCA